MYKKNPKHLTQRMFKWTPFIFISVMFLLGLMSGSVWAYEALPDFTGIQLKGTVKLNGKIPSPQGFNLVLFPDPYYCGRISDGKGWRLPPIPVLGNHKELAGAVVFLEDVKKGKLASPSVTTIQTKNCTFLPYLSVTQIGQTWHFQNWDPIQHKIEVFLTSQQGAEALLKKTLQPHPKSRKSDFLSDGQIGLHRPGPGIQYHIPEQGVFVFRCMLHDYMEGWNLVLPHPYFSITGENGEFSLKDIPPGSYNLIVWHPLGKQETAIEIRAQHTQNLSIFITPTVPTVYPGEESTNNPFGIDLVGDSSIVPTVERQEWDSGQKKAIGDAS